MPLVIHTHTHCSTLVWCKRFLTGDSRMAARHLLGAARQISHRPYCLPCQTLLAAKLVTRSKKILITAKLSHRSKDSGGTGVCLEHALLLASKTFSHGKVDCSEHSHPAAADRSPRTPQRASSFLRLAQVSRNQLDIPNRAVSRN